MSSKRGRGRWLCPHLHTGSTHIPEKQPQDMEEERVGPFPDKTLVSHSNHDLVSYRNVQASFDHDHSDEILEQSTMWPLEFGEICEH